MLKNVIEKLFNKSKQPDIFSPNYEKKLAKTYGTCDILKNNISLLIIADTHGTLEEENFKMYLKE